MSDAPVSQVTTMSQQELDATCACSVRGGRGTTRAAESSWWLETRLKRRMR
jgi:hypothetical protein